MATGASLKIRRRGLLKASSLLVLSMAALALSPWLLFAPPSGVPQVMRVSGVGFTSLTANSFRVATVNAAHGRGRGFHQALLAKEQQHSNLVGIGLALREAGVRAVALQEIDENAWWSGRVDQAGLIAEHAGLNSYIHGPQVATLGLRYGTALAVAGELSDTSSRSFRSGPLAPGKGFSVARWRPWGGADERTVTLVSLHLHFLPGARHREQTDALIADLNDLPRPLIVCGDFNASWKGGRGAPARVAAALGLVAWKHDAPSDDDAYRTHRSRRIDWILASPSLRWLDARTLDPRLSDHRFPVAEFEWALTP
jgi:endonuclease/exonuclease/phosphatase family metal-dependent hydrolase